MHLSVNVPVCVIDNLVREIGSQAVIGQQEIGVERRASFDMLPDFGLQHVLLAARNWLRRAIGSYFFGYVILVVTIFPLKANGAWSK